MSHKFLKVIEDGTAPVIDCGSCPVSIACAVGAGGTGFTFDCCGATAVETKQGLNKTIHIIDCANHNFEQFPIAKECKLCPLCSGDILTAVLADGDCGVTNLYVPTVHARVPLKTRIDAWRKALPKYQEAHDSWQKRLEVNRG